MSRAKIDWSTGSKKAYNDFIASRPEINIDYKTFRKVIYEFNHGIRDYILKTGDLVKLPGFGLLTIKKKKRVATKRLRNGKEIIALPIDWKKTREKGKIIYHMNFHTDGYYYSWKWFKKKSFIKYRNLWYFRASRIASRLIKKYISENPEAKYLYKEWKE
jgi:nucleoid DNA-binding protein